MTRALKPRVKDSDAVAKKRKASAAKHKARASKESKNEDYAKRIAREEAMDKGTSEGLKKHRKGALSGS